MRMCDCRAANKAELQLKGPLLRLHAGSPTFSLTSHNAAVKHAARRRCLNLQWRPPEAIYGNGTDAPDFQSVFAVKMNNNRLILKSHTRKSTPPLMFSRFRSKQNCQKKNVYACLSVNVKNSSDKPAVAHLITACLFAQTGADDLWNPLSGAESNVCSEVGKTDEEDLRG